MQLHAAFEGVYYYHILFSKHILMTETWIVGNQL